MTITIFLTLFTILSVVCSLFTEAIKKTIGTKEPTMVALILSAIVGWGGSAIAYQLMGIPFDTNSIICLALMAPVVWLGATLGYDKVMEIIYQIINTKPKG
jgi:hypothetical protein